jgi:hypothetical protein
MLRRHLWRWVTVAALAAFATAAAAPAGASAATASTAIARPVLCPMYARSANDTATASRCGVPLGYRTAALNHVGWTYLNLNYCAPGRACAMMYRMSMGAWRWTGSRWVAASLSQGWVYVSPYTGEWRWAWTQGTGWVAVSGGRFELR